MTNMENKAKIVTETETMPDGNKSAEAVFYLEMSGKPAKPHGYEYVGSYCVHVYEAKFSMDRNNYSFATLFSGKIPEFLAIESAKELNERLKARYGHVTKKTT